MKILDVVREVRRHLEENGRVSLRMLRRQYELDDEALDELIEELVDVQRVARREESVLVWAGPTRPEAVATTRSAPESNPRPYAQPAGRVPRTAAAHHVGQAETRKVISILFADLMGSTALQERLDPESVNRVMDAYYQAVRGPVEAAGGTVVQLLGDGVLCAFGIPTIAEDDALRAVRAAMGIQQAFREFLGTQQWLSVPIGLRVAVNTGEVVVSDEHPAGIGDPLNVAARLQQEARDGEVLIGQTTRRLVADAVTLEQAGVFALKGRAETVTAYRVTSLERPTGAAAAGFVGREQELARITAVYEAAVAAHAARLAVLVASPGLGKSRLIEEVSARLADTATVVTAHCDAVGGATFAPVAEALRTWLDRTPGSHSTALEAVIPESPERARIITGITALLAASPSSPEETFFVIRRFLTALAQSRPVVLVIDDLHWAEPLLLDLVEHLIQWGSGVPLFVLVGARPELRDLRSSLVTPGGLVSDVLTLSGLDAGAAMRLAANVIGASDLPAAIAAKVLATSEGNPLFVGELVRMLVDEGALERQGERWVVGANLAALEMPPTIHALLAARIERMRAEERIVLERAAVVGRHFSRGAVSALLGRNGNELDALLESLRRSELIERDTGWFLGEPMLRFHHVLIRDAAYRRLLKGTRAELHERLAEWIEARAGDVAEHDETIGWHLEQAHQLLGEIGPLDAAGRALGERAARHLAAAGRRALGRDDLPVAGDLLGRAINCLAADDAARADLALDWCEALLSAGDVGRAATAILELSRFAGGNDRTDRSDRTDRPDPRFRAWHTCFAAQLTVLTAPQALQTAADSVAAAAQQLGALGDAPGEAKAHSVHAQALARLGKVGACEAALDQALAAARRGGDRRRANAVLAGAPLAALWGPSPVTRASGRCLDVVRVLRITQGAPAVESVALSCQGVLEALRGRTEAARRMLASSRKMVEDLGIAHRLFEADAFAGRIAAMEGDTAGAERLLRSAYEGLRELGLGIDAARAGTLLARTLLAQDRVAEAESLSYESESLAGDDLQAAIAWRGVRAEALAKRGEHAAAVELAQAAVAIASATDALLDHADARVALAVALRAAGRAADADAEERRAIELWDAKGATLLADGARQRGTTEPKNDRPSLPRGDRRELERPDGSRSGPRLAKEGGPRRRVQPNAATAMLARLHAYLAARDFDAAAELSREDVKSIDHPSGSSYGGEAIVASLRRFFRSRDPNYEAEPLATLGDFLVLARRRTSASGGGGGRYDVGAYENDALELFEVDESGKTSRTEVFAADHLADAITRLYARHAERLPDGPERERAAVTARSLGTMLMAARDLERVAAVIAPNFEAVDHRHLSTWSMRGGAAFVEHLRALLEVAADVVIGTSELLALEPSALLIRRMHSGTERLGGGAYERPFLVLFATDAEGRVARAEWFDADREVEALTCFEALGSLPLKKGGQDGFVDGSSEQISLGPPFSKGEVVRRRVLANAATRDLERQWTAIEARDVDALTALSVGAKVIHHPTGATYGAAEVVALFRGLWRGTNLKTTQEILATLGDSLALARRTVAHDGVEANFGSVGPVEVEFVGVFDAQAKRSEIFAGDRLGEAITRLYARYAELLLEGPERERAAATARSVTVVAPGGFDLDGYTEVFRSDAAIVDHRVLGWGSSTEPQMLFRGMAAAREVGDRLMSRPQDVLALTHDALLLRWLAWGVGRESGGAFEWAFLRLFIFDRDGRVARYELFDDDREAEAIARFDELVGRDSSGSPLGEWRIEEEFPSAPFANAASRAVERNARCWAARDWDGVLAVLSPSLRYDDRRRLMRLEIGYEDFVVQFRVLFDQPASRWRETLIATRGERLALTRTNFEAEVTGGGGPLAFDEHLSLIEVDADGRWIACVTFDLEDLDAAHAELDARFEAGEAATFPHVVRALGISRLIRARDWPAWVAAQAPGFRYHDHRQLGFGDTVGDTDALLRLMQSTVALASDVRYRDDHVRISARGILRQTVLVGTRDGGAFENPMFLVFEVDEQGRNVRSDSYDIADRERALARFAELADSGEPAPDPFAEPFANAATRAVKRGTAALAARDWEGFACLMAPDFRHYDRTRIAQLETDGREWLASFRQLVEMTTEPPDYELLATRGERFALFTMLWRGAAGDVGPSEIDWRLIVEVNDRGEHTAIVVYDPDDVDAAYAELEARWLAGEAAEHPRAARWLAGYLDAFAARDWSAMTALFTPDLVAENHRLVGWGTRHGPEGVVSTLRAQIELAPDTRERVDHVRTCDGAVLFEYAWLGTREGGAFENQWLVLVELAPDGRACRAEVWEPEQLDTALARFAEIDARKGRSPHAASAKSNAATAAIERMWVSFDAGDPDVTAEALDTARVFFAPDFVWEDRRPMMGLSGDLDLMIASLRERVASGARPERRTIVGTAGDRVAVARVLWAGGPPDGRFEVEFLAVHEVNEAGLHTATLFFDVHHEDAAKREAWARWAAIDPVAAPWVELLTEITDAWNSHDRARLRARYADDIVVEDHRHAGLGRIEGAEAYLESIIVLWELAPDQRLEFGRSWPAVDRHGFVVTIRREGTVPDGGPFESEYLLLGLARNGRVTRGEFFEIDALDAALARFEELRPDPLHLPAATEHFENTASRAWRAVIAAWRGRDLERFAALQPAPLRYRDHRRLFQLDLDREGFLEFTRPLLTMRSARAALELLATRGEHLALMRFTLEMEDDVVGPSAIDSLLLIETDERGTIAAYDRYEVDDEDTARAEIQARWAAGEGTQFRNVGWNFDHSALVERRDWDALAAIYSPIVVGHDHRLVSWGTLRGRTEFLQSLRSMEALSPDARIRGDHMRVCARGLIMSNMWVGTRDGGAFESPFLAVAELDADGKVVRIDFYDPHHVDRALARFAEISASPPAGPIEAFLKGHAVTTALESWRVFDTGADPDWEALHASCAPDMAFEDRQGFARLSGDREMMIASLRERVASGARAERRLLGTAGERIAVMRMLWTGGPADGRFEIEYVSLVQLDEAGLVVAIILFGPDDERAAQREAWARWAAIDPVAAPWVELLTEISDAWNGHDRSRLRAHFADDVVVEDHRHAGLGRIEGADAYVDSNVVLWELAPDQRLEFGWSWPAVDRHGVVATLRREGTLADGGAFESECVWLGLARCGRLTRVELFEIDALDTALARFAELCASAAAEETA